MRKCKLNFCLHFFLQRFFSFDFFRTNLFFILLSFVFLWGGGSVWIFSVWTSSVFLNRIHHFLFFQDLHLASTTFQVFFQWDFLHIDSECPPNTAKWKRVTLKSNAFYLSWWTVHLDMYHCEYFLEINKHRFLYRISCQLELWQWQNNADVLTELYVSYWHLEAKALWRLLRSLNKRVRKSRSVLDHKKSGVPENHSFRHFQWNQNHHTARWFAEKSQVYVGN